MFISQVSSAKCQVCGAPLTVHDQVRGDVCERAACRTVALKRRLGREHDERVAVEAEADRRLRERCSKDATHLVILPVSQRELTHLPERRRRRFRDRLNQVISQATAARFGSAEVGPENEHPVQDSPASLPERVQVGGCSLCRGDCCHEGQDYAYLQPATILRYWDGHPSARPSEIFERYLACVGYRTIEASCIYHGEHGCTLALEMRSALCNTFWCNPFRDFVRQVESDEVRRVFAVAVESGQIIREDLIETDI